MASFFYVSDTVFNHGTFYSLSFFTTILGILVCITSLVLMLKSQCVILFCNFKYFTAFIPLPLINTYFALISLCKHETSKQIALPRFSCILLYCFWVSMLRSHTCPHKETHIHTHMSRNILMNTDYNWTIHAIYKYIRFIDILKYVTCLYALLNGTFTHFFIYKANWLIFRHIFYNA